MYFASIIEWHYFQSTKRILKSDVAVVHPVNQITIVDSQIIQPIKRKPNADLQNIQSKSNDLSAAFRYDTNVGNKHERYVYLGDLNKKCPFCNVMKWRDETDGFCCGSGNIGI